MAAPILPILLRLLFSVQAKSTQSLITKIYNMSGKTISQKRLWELSRSTSGVRQLEQIYNQVKKAPTLTKLKKEIAKKGIKIGSDADINDMDISSMEIRTYLANKVIKRLSSAGSNMLKVKPFMVRLASNILSGGYSTEGFTLDEIIDYIDNASLTDMIETFKAEALYYG